MNIEGLETENENHLDFTVYELHEALNSDEETLDNCFETHEADEVTAELAIRHYEAIIADKNAQIGHGNSALVYKRNLEDENGQRCIKCRWDFLMVNNKSKKIERLPGHLQPLKKIEQYFKEISEKKSILQKKGKEFIPENKVLREAVIQKLAHQVVNEAGLNDAVPDIQRIIQIEREESGPEGSDIYSASEVVDLMFMDRVQGLNLEEIIYSLVQEVAEKLDVDLFEKELREILGVLHDAGIAHRDLIIRNIMIDLQNMKPKVIDFGKSKVSGTISAEDKARDLHFVDEAMKLLRKFKENPEEARNRLAEMHQD